MKKNPILVVAGVITLSVGCAIAYSFISYQYALAEATAAYTLADTDAPVDPLETYLELERRRAAQ